MRNSSTCHDEATDSPATHAKLQILLLLTLTLLHLAPYGVIVASQGSWSGLLYVIGGLLSGPFAQAALLGFYLIVGTRADWQRRLILGFGILAVTLAVCLALNEFAIFWLPAFTTAALTCAVTLFLVIRSRPFHLERPSGPPRFSLAEVTAWLFVAGAVFGLTRWLGGDRLAHYTWTEWENDLGPHSIIHGTFVGLMVAIYALPLLAYSRKVRWWAVWASCLTWAVLPLVEIATLYLYSGDFSVSSWRDTMTSGIYMWGVSGAVWLLAWGTMLPLKLLAGGLVRGQPPPPGADPPSPPTDFAELS